jgi:hypothetical protein
MGRPRKPDSKTYTISVKLTREQYEWFEMLKRLGINRNQVIRDAIDVFRKIDPEKLQKKLSDLLLR